MTTVPSTIHPLADVLERFATGRAAEESVNPDTMARDVEAIIAAAEARDMHEIMIVQPRKNPVGRTTRLKLFGQRGPYCASDRGITHSSGLASAWWRVADLRAWLAGRRRSATVHPWRGGKAVCP